MRPVFVHLIAALGFLGVAWYRWSHQIPTGGLELVSTITGILAVILVVKNNVWNWPIGLVCSVTTYFYLMDIKLFADAYLQIFYLVMGLLGWYWWLRGGKEHGKLLVGRIGIREFLASLAIGTAFAVWWTPILAKYGDPRPALDAVTTSLSLVAQYYVMRKYFENWIGWLIVNTVYVYLYWTSDMHYFAVLYGYYWLLALLGTIEWKELLRTQSEAKA